MPSISYAIPVCNEHEELGKLLTLLTTFKRSHDEIVVQCDQGNTTFEVYKVLEAFKDKVKVVEFPLKGNFATFKNNLKANCQGAWIVQLDADELLEEEFITHLPDILRDNPTIELLCLPRINTVEGLTEDHIRQWGWRVSENGWVNFPDIQTRIIQNTPKISWVGKVHEVVTGHTTHAVLPLEPIYCILHHKQIKRQEMQNTMYSLI
ncbi:MAG: glycosyltransferase [Terrimicrobiaceae bacterium]